MSTPAFLWVLLLPLLACLSARDALAADTSNTWKSTKGVIVVVGSPFIDLYVEPGRSHARSHVAEKNQRLRLFKSRAGWYQAETEDGHIGWIPRSALNNVFDTEGYPLDFSIPRWQDADNPWQMGLLGSSFGGAKAYTVFGGYRFTPNISAELRYTQAFGESTNYNLGSGALLHQLFPKWRASPFITLGAGEIKIYRDSVNAISVDEKDIAVSVGGGFIYYLTYNVSARIEYNHHTLLTTRDNNEEVDEWKAGFSVLF